MTKSVIALLAELALQVTFNTVDKDYKKKYLPGGKKYVPPPASISSEQTASQGAKA